MRRCRPLLGTYVEITAETAESIDAGFAAIEHVHSLMSAHDPESELSRINRFAHRRPVVVSNEVREVLVRALDWSRLSRGLFDVVAAGAKSLALGLIPEHPDQPAPEALDSSALSLTGNLVHLAVPACLDLGGIAKGFAVDQAVRAMRRAGASSGLVNAGGDVFGFGAEAWPVGVIHPRTRVPLVEVELRDEALATSALHIDGSGGHLPAAARWMSVTVKAANACDADALTKILWVGGMEAQEALDRSGASAFGIAPDGTVEAIMPTSAAA